jgi:hypothetical protein
LEKEKLAQSLLADRETRRRNLMQKLSQRHQKSMNELTPDELTQIENILDSEVLHICSYIFENVYESS